MECLPNSNTPDPAGRQDPQTTASARDRCSRDQSEKRENSTTISSDGGSSTVTQISSSSSRGGPRGGAKARNRKPRLLIVRKNKRSDERNTMHALHDNNTTIITSNAAAAAASTTTSTTATAKVIFDPISVSQQRPMIEIRNNGKQRFEIRDDDHSDDNDGDGVDEDNESRCSNLKKEHAHSEQDEIVQFTSSQSEEDQWSSIASSESSEASDDQSTADAHATKNKRKCTVTQQQRKAGSSNYREADRRCRKKKRRKRKKLELNCESDNNSDDSVTLRSNIEDEDEHMRLNESDHRARPVVARSKRLMKELEENVADTRVPLSAIMAQDLVRMDVEERNQPPYKVLPYSLDEKSHTQRQKNDSFQTRKARTQEHSPGKQTQCRTIHKPTSTYPFNILHSRYSRFIVTEMKNSTVERRTANGRIVSDRALLLSATPDGNTLRNLTTQIGREINDNDPSDTDSSDLLVHTIILTGRWLTMTVRLHDVVHVIGSFDEQRVCRITNDDGILVINPDILVSVSVLSGSLKCPRRAHLMSKFTEFSLPASLVGVTQLKADYGTMLHRIFQKALEHQDFSKDNLHRLVEEEVTSESLTMFTDSKSSQDARDHLNSFVEPLQRWAEKFWGSDTAKGGAVPFFLDKSDDDNDGSESFIRISELIDVEESIWSTAFGLTGNVDATMEAEVWNKSGGLNLYETIPLEVKSGRSFEVGGTVAHRAQLISYQAMMSDKYNTHFSHSLLYYMSDGKLLGVPFDRLGFRDIIISRNELVQSLSNAELVRQISNEQNIESDSRSENEDGINGGGFDNGILDIQYHQSERQAYHLAPDIEDDPFGNIDPMEMDDVVLRIPRAPAMSSSSNVCKFCFRRETCMLYTRIMENGVGIDRSGVAMFDYTEATSHITDRHAEFAKRWLRLIDLEELHKNHFKKEIWCLTGPEREQRGRCLSSLAIIEHREEPSGGFIYVFRKHPSMQKHVSINFKATALEIGSYVVISTEIGHTKISSGIVQKLCEDELVVHTTNKLRIPKVRPRRDVRSDRIGSGLSTSTVPVHRKGGMADIIDDTIQIPGEDNMLWRIDVDDHTGYFGTLRSNIVQLLYGSQDQHSATNRILSQIRSRVIDMAPPVYEETVINFEEQLPWTRQLNEDQQCALQKVLAARDYALILGMPGTGKTTTIVHVIRALAHMGKKVLVSAYTHSALDNILLKLKKYDDVNFARFGNRRNVNPNIREHMIDQFETTEQVAEFIEKTPVFACSCLSTNSGIFCKIEFDYCIVDEASQITLPAVLGPIRFADKFVLVGDHYQLPPLVQSRRAIEYGMQESLFDTLCRAHPSHVVFLKYQYRMNEQILQLSNSIIYDNMLQCGTDEIAKAKLRLPFFTSFLRREPPFTQENGYEYDDWLAHVLDPERQVIFVDTDQTPAREERVGRNVFNPTEAILAVQIATAMVHCGVPLEEIGIVCPLRMQTSAIMTRLMDAGLAKIDVLTIDKFQGLDKQCIIVCLVRSNEKQEIHEIMRDRRRINVAFTRAKHKLIVLGSLTTHHHHYPIRQFIDLIRQHHLIYSLCANAHLKVAFPTRRPDVTASIGTERTPVSNVISSTTQSGHISIDDGTQTPKPAEHGGSSEKQPQLVQLTLFGRARSSAITKPRKMKKASKKKFPAFTLSETVKRRLAGKLPVSDSDTMASLSGPDRTGPFVSMKAHSESPKLKKCTQNLLALLSDRESDPPF